MSGSNLSLQRLADIIFDRFPPEELKKYDEQVFKKVLTVKKRFIAYCWLNWKYAKYSEKETIKRLNKIFKESFFYKDGKFDFSIFNEIMGECFSEKN